jgi:hypothetical protein
LTRDHAQEISPPFEPFLDIAVFAGAYAVWVALLMVVNRALLKGELTWIETWVIWGISSLQRQESQFSRE